MLGVALLLWASTAIYVGKGNLTIDAGKHGVWLSPARLVWGGQAGPDIGNWDHSQRIVEQ